MKKYVTEFKEFIRGSWKGKIGLGLFVIIIIIIVCVCLVSAKNKEYSVWHVEKINDNAVEYNITENKSNSELYKIKQQIIEEIVEEICEDIDPNNMIFYISNEENPYADFSLVVYYMDKGNNIYKISGPDTFISKSLRKKLEMIK